MHLQNRIYTNSFLIAPNWRNFNFSHFFSAIHHALKEAPANVQQQPIFDPMARVQHLERRRELNSSRKHAAINCCPMYCECVFEVECTNLDRDMISFRPPLIVNGDEDGVRNGRRDVGKVSVTFFLVRSGLSFLWPRCVYDELYDNVTYTHKYEEIIRWVLWIGLVSLVRLIVFVFFFFLVKSNAMYAEHIDYTSNSMWFACTLNMHSVSTSHKIRAHQMASYTRTTIRKDFQVELRMNQRN